MMRQINQIMYKTLLWTSLLAGIIVTSSCAHGLNTDGIAINYSLMDSTSDALPQGWTCEDRAMRVLGPEGEREIEIRYYRNSMGMEFVRVPAGEFMMGSPDSEEGGNRTERPQHRVVISKPFLMGIHEVTNEEYRRFRRGHHTRHIKNYRGIPCDDDRQPVGCVSWFEAKSFCSWLSKREGIYYQLPTEAHWEYACRAGTSTPFAFGNSINTSQVNFSGKPTIEAGTVGEFRAKSSPVGMFLPNLWGLHDMHGNVYEWCSDWLNHDYYSERVLENPQGPKKATAGLRVLRGGNWDMPGNECRSAARSGMDPEIDLYIGAGFRVCVLIP